jgi:HKD family nuclease
MRLIYTNVPPLSSDKELRDEVDSLLEKSDTFEVAVGYASEDGLLELYALAEKHKVNVKLILGMYCIEGWPENIYNTACRLNVIWMQKMIGEIRAVTNMKYHGKIYVFRKEGETIAAIIGSHNLGAIKKNADNQRQYELSTLLDDAKSSSKVSDFFSNLWDSVCVENLKDLPPKLREIKKEPNKSLDNVEGVEKSTPQEWEDVHTHKTSIVFDLPLKVPGIPGNKKEYMGSNINKCYAKGRETKKTGKITPRNWWEIEEIVSKNTTANLDYPQKKGEPFWVYTDDGFKFLAHVGGDFNKNFESHADLKILGYWLKGRLVAAGIVKPVDDISADLNRKDNSLEDPYSKCEGVVTYKKLLQYGKTTLRLTKTDLEKPDNGGIERPVWLLDME